MNKTWPKESTRKKAKQPLTYAGLPLRHRRPLSPHRGRSRCPVGIPQGSPLPVVTHVISVTIYCFLGAFQFHPGLRRRRPRWHRTAGRIVIPTGLVAAVSGLWMSQFYQLPAYDGELLYVFRMFFGFAMMLAIILALAAILRRDITRHQAWMMRGYAIAIGAGTQAFTLMPWILIAGEPSEFPRALLMGAGWVINLAVAEWIIRRRPPGSIDSANRCIRANRFARDIRSA